MRMFLGLLLGLLLIWGTPSLYGKVHALQKEENLRVIIKYNNLAKNGFSNNNDRTVEIKTVKREKFKSYKKEWEKDKGIEYVEEDHFYNYTNINDPYFRYQEKSFQIMNVQTGWNKIEQNDNVTVAVLDSGIDQLHPDLKENIIKPYNVLEPGSLPVDQLGHGTHVAGIIGAKTNNEIGIASIAHNVAIMPVKVGDEHGAYASHIAEGIEYAIDNGAEIINISIAGPKNRYVQEAINKATNMGILVVAAAGNNATDTIEYPAGYPGVLSVGAISISEELAGFSNFGDSVSVVAVGSKVLSTFPTNKTTQLQGYIWMDGTSMAAPMVASQAALLKSMDKNLTSKQLIDIIETSSVKKAAYPVRHGKIDIGESIEFYHDKNRIYGINSLETAVKIAEKGWKSIEETSFSNESVEWKGKFAILASNQNFADSLSVVPLAYKLDSPIYLSEKNFLPLASMSSMEKLGVNHVIIIGGEQAISANVEKKLNDSGLRTIRIAGRTRFDTAVKIGELLDPNSGKVMIVNGNSFPDALSASVEAAKKEMPIIFVEQSWIPAATKDFLKKGNFSEKYIIGGTRIVNKTIEKDLKAKRISGANRYETNIAVVNYFQSTYETYYFATGSDYKDALTGGLLASKENSGLMLVKHLSIDDTTKTFLYQNPTQNYSVLGGKKAIHSSVVWKIDKILNGN
ncbi:S8 family serine peptidase [Sutcliffiella rhizosphaerae]|uniref:Peptidase S8/S53 domain-containing protein n=1 Tax=Sutcliffiella rhizosphaerae TaxID=2880967 RepID=A0ABN8A8H7_9BACI|nr:S8 family serine peptidase [Sutcliffiella rhizosphaerae]CAG9621420.1 hypothetical protein BACCIP111883_02193 [Sutcliffiella rhizosphaerae]